MDPEGIDPSTSRMRNGRATTAPWARPSLHTLPAPRHYNPHPPTINTSHPPLLPQFPTTYTPRLAHPPIPLRNHPTTHPPHCPNSAAPPLPAQTLRIQLPNAHTDFGLAPPIFPSTRPLFSPPHPPSPPRLQGHSSGHYRGALASNQPAWQHNLSQSVIIPAWSVPPHTTAKNHRTLCPRSQTAA